MEVEMYSGMLNYYKPTPLGGKKKIKKFAALYKHSIHGVQRLELFDSQESFQKKDKIKKQAHIINLERCTHVDKDKITDGKKTEYVIIVQFESDEKSQTFLWDTENEMTMWLSCLQSVLFGRKDGFDNDCIFEVEIKPNEVSDKLSLRGTYLLSVSLDDIELLDRQTRKPIIKWPLHLLRKYGRDKQEFSLEAGRRCPSGPGLFCFKTDHYNVIFRAVEGNIKSRAARSRTNSDTTNNHPLPAPVPPSPSVYDNPLDAKPTKDSLSDVYSEPVNSHTLPSKSRSKQETSKQKDKKNKIINRKSSRIVSTPLPQPVMTEEATYADPTDLGHSSPDLSTEYSHLNIEGGHASEAEYDSISYQNNWQGNTNDSEYATTINGSAGDDGLYDHVLR